MRLAICGFLLVASVCCNAAHAKDGFPAIAPQDVAVLYWENQSWKPSGSAVRLTLWRDGRSEITFESHADRSKTPPLKAGWKEEDDNTIATTYYRKADPLSKSEAKSRFNAALEAGILKLISFKPDYIDGSGTLVGIQTGGKEYSLIIPQFAKSNKKDARADSQKGSSNEKQFLAVKQAIGVFETEPFLLNK